MEENIALVFEKEQYDAMLEAVKEWLKTCLSSTTHYSKFVVPSVSALAKNIGMRISVADVIVSLSPNEWEIVSGIVEAYGEGLFEKLGDLLGEDGSYKLMDRTLFDHASCTIIKRPSSVGIKKEKKETEANRPYSPFPKTTEEQASRYHSFLYPLSKTRLRHESEVNRDARKTPGK